MIGSIGLATQWLHAETIRILGLTLGHFLWEGSALALLLFVTVAFCRRAQTRYTLAVCTLAAMLVAPIFTFVILSRAPQIAVPGASTSGITHLTSGIPAMAIRILESTAPESSGSWPVWCACIWFGGVFLLSVR